MKVSDNNEIDNQNPLEITPDEIMVFCLSRQINDGEVVVQGLATPMIAAAFILARQTHAPNLYFASAIGQGICRSPAPIGLSHVEELWIERNIKNISFVDVAAEFLPWIRPKEFFRPAQVDMKGNFNNIAFGKDFHSPRLRLPGTGGIPDMTVFSSSNYLYVPRHSRIVFVPDLDFRSGLGHVDERTTGKGPAYLVTDLGQFDFFDGEMRLITLHPGVSVEKVQSRTGFPIKIADNLRETPLPGYDELKLLRNDIDPMGIRNLESLQGSARRKLLRQIIMQETARAVA